MRLQRFRDALVEPCACRRQEVAVDRLVHERVCEPEAADRRGLLVQAVRLRGSEARQHGFGRGSQRSLEYHDVEFTPDDGRQ